MSRYLKYSATNMIGCVLIIFLFNLASGIFTAHYCLSHWFHQDVSYVLSGLVGFIFAEFFFPAAIVTWMLVLWGVIA